MGQPCRKRGGAAVGAYRIRAAVRERGGRGAAGPSGGTGGPAPCTGDLEGEWHWQPGGDAN